VLIILKYVQLCQLGGSIHPLGTLLETRKAQVQTKKFSNCDKGWFAYSWANFLARVCMIIGYTPTGQGRSPNFGNFRMWTALSRLADIPYSWECFCTHAKYKKCLPRWEYVPYVSIYVPWKHNIKPIKPCKDPYFSSLHTNQVNHPLCSYASTFHLI
jgi:hypothetical protein